MCRSLRLVSTLLVGAALLVSGVGVAGEDVAAGYGAPTWWHSSVKVLNRSEHDIHHLYVSRSDDPGFGPDQLGSDVLEAGTWVKLTGLACTDYDLELIDEEGDECVLQRVKLCREDATWVLDEETLRTCEGF